jgi:hypothetical protein
VFDYHVAENTKLSLMFIVNNEHMYLLSDDELKKIVQHKKHLDLNQVRDLELETFDEKDRILLPHLKYNSVHFGVILGSYIKVAVL